MNFISSLLGLNTLKQQITFLVNFTQAESNGFKKLRSQIFENIESEIHKNAHQVNIMKQKTASDRSLVIIFSKLHGHELREGELHDICKNAVTSCVNAQYMNPSVKWNRHCTQPSVLIQFDINEKQMTLETWNDISHCILWLTATIFVLYTFIFYIGQYPKST